MPRPKPAGLDRHPIQVVVRRTGLSPDVIRVWERRYQAVRPGRSSGDRRLYSEEQIDRLLLLRRATLGGRSIGQVARLETGALRRLVVEDEAAARMAPLTPRRPAAAVAAGPGEAEPEAHVQACLEAIRGLDEAELGRVLSLAGLGLSRIRLIDQVLLPLMRRVGDLWHEGSMRIVHEHLAFTVVRNVLAGLLEGGGTPRTAPHLVVATPAGQIHELGAMAAVAHAIARGWRVTNLGANLPADEIAAAAHGRPTRAVALSLVYPGDDPGIPGEIRRLRRQLREDIALIAGGRAAADYAAALDEAGARRLEDLAALRGLLDELRAPPPAAGA